jgi:hypothetical protein
MILSKVNDIKIEDVINRDYDISFFSCGYEQRASAVSKTLERTRQKTIATLYFKDLKKIGNREQNNNHFNKITDIFIDLKYDEELPIYNFLNEYVQVNQNKQLRLLVDYSSMSRLWYTSILNWARFINLDKITIDFVYSVGEYNKTFSPLTIEEILALPGHEGITTHSKTISIFGLGFDSLTTLCVLDKLEPSKVHSYIAIPMCKEYENKSENYNKEFIENYSEPIQYYPLTSLEKTYRLMSELILPYIDNYNISFIPMGPKPHVLASILLSTKYNQVINLYVKGKRELPPDVVANGDFICTQVTLSV